MLSLINMTSYIQYTKLCPLILLFTNIGRIQPPRL